MDNISKDEKISVTENTASLKFFRKGERIIHKECYFFVLTLILLISTTVFHLVLLYIHSYQKVSKYYCSSTQIHHNCS